jgi:flagellar biosynthesis/type III secretory pathway protein FliH
MRLLLDSPVLSTLALKRLHEAIMNEQIPVTTAEQETNYQRITRITREAALLEGRQEGRHEGRQEARASLLELVSRYAPERLAELQQVDDMNTLREALDQAIQQRLAGVRQG